VVAQVQGCAERGLRAGRRAAEAVSLKRQLKRQRHRLARRRDADIDSNRMIIRIALKLKEIRPPG
jgi:hypothetical protein